MPLYEYDCPRCGKFETMKAMNQRHRARCPRCSSESKLVMSTFGISYSGDSKWEHRKGTVKIPEKDW